MNRRTLQAALATAALLLVGACGNDPVETGADTHDKTKHGTHHGKDGDTASGSDDESTGGGSSSGGGSGGDTVTVPVYFVGDTPQGPRLFREFQKVSSADPLGEAVTLMTSGQSLDPDYRTLYPGGDFADVTWSEGAGAFVVSVKDDGWNTAYDGMSSRTAKLAVQQLVYTVQGVQQRRDPVLVQKGNDAVPLFGVDTASGVSNDGAALGLVNVTSPEQGATVSGGNLDVSGVANSFEANVVWEIRSGNTKVMDGYATADGWMDKLYPWQTSIDVSGLEPGDYTFVASTDDPSDGEGAGPMVDTKDFSIS